MEWIAWSYWGVGWLIGYIIGVIVGIIIGFTKRHQIENVWNEVWKR